jgi:hypothetical protein
MLGEPVRIAQRMTEQASALLVEVLAIDEDHDLARAIFWPRQEVR